jgi:hypothetical protein
MGGACGKRGWWKKNINRVMVRKTEIRRAQALMGG